MIDWKKIRNRAETATLLSGMAAGYLAPGLIWGATDRTLQLSPCSCEEAIASDDEDHEVTDCYHLKPFSVRDIATDDWTWLSANRLMIVRETEVDSLRSATIRWARPREQMVTKMVANGWSRATPNWRVRSRGPRGVAALQ